MGSRLKSRRVLFAGLLLAAIAALGVAAGIGTAQTSVISEATAVDRSLAYARAGQRWQLIGEPTEMRGQVMKYEEAHAIRHRTTIDSSSAIARLRNDPVWFIVLRGEILYRAPAAAGGDIPEKEYKYTQMSIVLHGTTAELLGIGLYPPGRELAVDSMPRLSRPTGTVPPVPTPQTLPTTAPAPPKPPAPLPPIR